MPGAPFNPTTGEHAHLGPFPARGTTLGLFQVIGDDPTDPDTADTHDNYVVCRGYESESDPEHQFLHDPYTAESTTPIMVAKPYGVRGTFPYEQGQVIVAARIRNKLGYNAGKAKTTVGQPEDLDEEVVLLTDDDGVGISWLDIAQTFESDLLGKADANIGNGAAGQVSVWEGPAGAEVDTGDNVTVRVKGAAVVKDQWVRAHLINGRWYIIELTNEQLGKPDADILKGTTGTVSIWNGPAGLEADSGINIDAYAKGATVYSGKLVVLGNMNGVWYVAPWEQ